MQISGEMETYVQEKNVRHKLECAANFASLNKHTRIY